MCTATLGHLWPAEQWTDALAAACKWSSQQHNNSTTALGIWCWYPRRQSSRGPDGDKDGCCHDAIPWHVTLHRDIDHELTHLFQTHIDIYLLFQTFCLTSCEKKACKDEDTKGLSKSNNDVAAKYEWLRVSHKEDKGLRVIRKYNSWGIQGNLSNNIMASLCPIGPWWALLTKLDDSRCVRYPKTRWCHLLR